MSGDHPDSGMPGLRTMRKAIATRDRRFDGRFVYGVVTTGVFCRPSCASRLAKPENVRFFATAAQAQAAALRPCKRCDPAAADSRSSLRIQSLAEFIDRHADEPLSLGNLARRAHWSPAHLQRTFKTVLGVSPKAYHDAARLRLLKGSLKAGKSVLAAIDGAGFQSSSRVYARGTRNLGMTPSAYRAGGTGETISYAFRETALGPLLMAATDRGVCFAQFGSGEMALVAQLQTEFPHASVAASGNAKSTALDDWMRAFEKHIAGHAPRPGLPLDMLGTAFQIRVWRFLLAIPEGDVVSYAEVAKGIGKPTAVRATASACAGNRIAVLVPCHRVLRSDGGLGGYRWGLERKRLLIAAERRRGVE